MKCIHGIDPRFCAVCNRASRSTKPSSPTVTLADILAYLNGAQIRATYGAVAEALGVPAPAMARALEPRRPEASWVVHATNGMPTGYSADECHPGLLSQSEMITSGSNLLLRLAAQRKH